MNKKIIFDTDLGSDIDDALALVYLANRANLSAVSTVYGPVETRAYAASTLLASMDRNDIEVVPGEALPLSPDISIWLTGNEEYLVNQHAQISVNSYEKVYANIDKFQTIATGPLTNIAKLCNYPWFKEKCKQLVIMGGTIFPNDQLPEIEHNFKQDPEAARIVFESHIPIVLAPVDLTLRFPLPAQYEIAIKEDTRNHIHLLWEWMQKWRNYLRALPPSDLFYDKLFLHDPIAAAYPFHSDLFTAEKMELQIDSSGRVIVGKGNPVTVLTNMQIEVITYIFESILTKAPGSTSIEGQLSQSSETS